MILTTNNVKHFMQTNIKSDHQMLQRLLNSFSASTKLFIVLTDVNGEVIMQSGQDSCEFCNIIKSNSLGRERCKSSYVRAGVQAGKWNEPYFFKCHAGLVSWASRVEFSNMHIGNLICGQVSIWKPDKLFLLEVEEVAKTLGIDGSLLVSAIKKMEVLSAEQVQATADLLFIISNYLTQSGFDIFNYQQKLRKVGSWFWLENYKFHDRRSTGLSQPENKADDLKKDLMRQLRKGNLEEARRLLDQIFVQFFIDSKGQIEKIKGLCIELITSLARFSTECGIKFEDSFRIDSLRLKELENSETVEKVLLWLLSVGNSYFELLASKTNEPHKLIIEKVSSYISEHYYSRDLSLDRIAKANYFSAAYLNRLFKKITGKTIMEYVTFVRINQAKILLKKSNKSIDEIAREVGYSDRSYFSKSFKKEVGITPGEYRRMNLA